MQPEQRACSNNPSTFDIHIKTQTDKQGEVGAIRTLDQAELSGKHHNKTTMFSSDGIGWVVHIAGTSFHQPYPLQPSYTIDDCNGCLLKQVR